MSVNASLFDLVKAMAMQEKRHFKLMLSRYGKNGKNSVALFDALDKMKVHDEKLLRKKHSGKPFLNFLPAEKKYLEKLIHKSLRQYHAAVSVDVEIKELLIDAEILHGKSLFDHCRRILLKAKKLSLQYERFSFLPEIVRLESRLYDLDHLASVYVEEQDALEKLKTISRFRALSNRVAKFVAKTHHLRSEKEKEAFEKLMQNPLLENESAAGSFTAKVYYFYIKGVYFELKGDVQNGYKSRKRFAEIMEANPGQLEIHTRNYLTVLNNLGISQLDLQMFEEAESTAEKIAQLPAILKSAKEQDVKINSFVFSSILKLNVLIRSGEFEKGLSFSKGIEKQMHLYEGKIHRQFEIVLWNSLKYIAFGAGEFRIALRWQNKIMQEETSEIRSDIQSMSRIFNLVLHFELGNTDHLEYILKSTYKYLAQAERLYKVESIVLKYLRRVPELNSSKKQQEFFNNLHRELSPLAKNKFEKKAFHEFDLLAWLESKMERISFATAVARKRK